jgi:hypothetical protein
MLHLLDNTMPYSESTESLTNAWRKARRTPNLS